MEWTPVLLDLPDDITGPRIVLRPYLLEDTEALWASINESRVHIGTWLPWVDTYRQQEDVRAFIVQSQVKWLLREDLPMGIFDRATGRHLGGTGLHRINWDVRRFEIGYWLRKSAEGNGYATEATRLLTQFAFDRLEANRVEIRMDPGNARSLAVPRRLGFTFEGTLRRCSAPRRGEADPRDSHVFALIREEYQALSW